MLDPLAVLKEMRRVCVARRASGSARHPCGGIVRSVRTRRSARGCARNRIDWITKLEDLLSRSFPEPGDADRLRKLYADSLAGDTLGIATRREGDTLRFDFPVV